MRVSQIFPFFFSIFYARKRIVFSQRTEIFFFSFIRFTVRREKSFFFFLLHFFIVRRQCRPRLSDLSDNNESYNIVILLAVSSLYPRVQNTTFKTYTYKFDFIIWFSFSRWKPPGARVHKRRVTRNGLETLRLPLLHRRFLVKYFSADRVRVHGVAVRTRHRVPVDF